MSLFEQDRRYVTGKDLPAMIPDDYPEHLTVEDALEDKRLIRDTLSTAKWQDRLARIMEAMAERAMDKDDPGANKAAELLLNYAYGKPVGTDVTVQRQELSGDDIARLAERVRGG